MTVLEALCRLDRHGAVWYPAQPGCMNADAPV
jgi:hypothetical protein